MDITTTAITTENSADLLPQFLAAAEKAAAVWSATSAQDRAAVLDRIADALDDNADELIPVAMEETNLPEGRLRGELMRTSFQLRLFGETIRDGGYADVRIDHADPEWPMGAPRPDLRRYHRAIGPVAVFSASNFPFAFSVLGGDTASALAAGNPVIVKGHAGHMELSRRTTDVAQRAIKDAGAPEGLLSLVLGREVGTELVTAPQIKAAGFTGSIPGGRALMNLAVSRPDPIPFYGELGSNNPVFVTQAAAEERGDEIAEQFLGSFTMGAGQFCTKPGTLFVPKNSGMVEALRGSALPDAAKLLNNRIQEGYVEELQKLSGQSGVEVLLQGSSPYADPPAPTLLLTSMQNLLDNREVLQSECFGPTALVIEYDNEQQLVDAAATYDGQLTATIQGEETCDVAALVTVLAEKAGRVLWNQWPTGVSVTYAQQHGGPYPATTAPGSTSVGTAAIERFLRPVAYQNFPQHLLPQELQEDNPLAVPRLVDGQRSDS